MLCQEAPGRRYPLLAEQREVAEGGSGDFTGVTAEQVPFQEVVGRTTVNPMANEGALKLQTEALGYTKRDKQQLEAKAVESQKRIAELKGKLSKALGDKATLKQSLAEQRTVTRELSCRIQRGEEDEVAWIQEIKRVKTQLANQERLCHQLRQRIQAQEVTLWKLNNRLQRSEEEEVIRLQEMEELKTHLAHQEQLCYHLRERIGALRAEIKQVRKEQESRDWERNVELHVTRQMDDMIIKILLVIIGWLVFLVAGTSVCLVVTFWPANSVHGTVLITSVWEAQKSGLPAKTHNYLLSHVFS